MNRWYYIISSLIVVLICSADGCNENQEAVALREKMPTSELIDSVKQVFTVDTLPQTDLTAYEISAVQKLSDLADYLDAVSDTTLNFLLRRQAYEMIIDLFYPESDLRQLSVLCPGCEPESTDSLAHTGLPKGLPCSIRPSDINITDHFVKVNDNTFRGALSFSQTREYASGKPVAGDLPQLYKIEIYLVRNMKSFGNQKLNVWDTYLGDIDLIN